MAKLPKTTISITATAEACTRKSAPILPLTTNESQNTIYGTGDWQGYFSATCSELVVRCRMADGQWRVRSHTGDPAKMRAPSLRTLDWIGEVQRLGAGEIVLNCMDSDGVRRGYDLVQLKALRALLHIPLVASGGAHFALYGKLSPWDHAAGVLIHTEAGGVLRGMRVPGHYDKPRKGD